MISFVSAFSQSESHASNGSSDDSLWYLRLGPMSEKGLNILSKRGLVGNHKVELLQFFEHCAYGKQHWRKFLKVVHITKAMLEYVHSDYLGPLRVPSLGGPRYFLSIIDDYSRMTWVFMMKQKSKFSSIGRFL